MESASTLRGRSFEPREISDEETALRIVWSDEAVCHYPAPALRRLCPCAQCVNEWTGERVLQPEAIPNSVTIRDLELVGRYALTIEWSDNHTTGIYSFRYLREICEAENLREVGEEDS